MNYYLYFSASVIVIFLLIYIFVKIFKKNTYEQTYSNKDTSNTKKADRKSYIDYSYWFERLFSANSFDLRACSIIYHSEEYELDEYGDEDYDKPKEKVYPDNIDGSKIEWLLFEVEWEDFEEIKIPKTEKVIWASSSLCMQKIKLDREKMDYPQITEQKEKGVFFSQESLEIVHHGYDYIDEDDLEYDNFVITNKNIYLNSYENTKKININKLKFSVSGNTELIIIPEKGTGYLISFNDEIDLWLVFNAVKNANNWV